MATYYVSHTGAAFGNAGTKLAPWTMDRATQAVANVPAPGDTIRIRSGTYSYADSLFTLRVSGTSDTSRITYLHNWDGDVEADVIFDGALGAATGAGATAKTSGWALAGGTGILTYGDGTTSGSGAPYVYQKDVGGASVLGVFVNDYVPGSATSTLTAPGTANYWWVSCWNMGWADSYGANPSLRIHDTDPGHDIETATGLPKHDWRGQFKQSGTTLYARGYDSTSLNTHSTYIGVGNKCVTGNGTQYVTIDGGASKRFKFYRYKEPIYLTGCQNITLTGCEARWGGGSVVTVDTGSGIVVDGCLLYGGMPGRHDSTVVWFSGASNCTVQNCDLAYGGHDTVQVKNSSNCVVRANEIHHTPHGVFVLYGCPGLLIERNDIHDTGFTACTLAHKVPHNGMHLGEMSNSVIRRNKIVRGGNGINKRGLGWQNCLLYNNTIHDCEDCGIFIEDTESAQNGATHDNVIQNNIVINSRNKWAVANHLFGNATNAGWNNKFRNNCLYTPAEGNNQVSCWSYYDDIPSAMTVAQADGNARAWIGSNWDANQDGDPQLTDPGGATRDISETAGSTLTINRGSETGLLGRPNDIAAVSTIDIGAWEDGGTSTNAAPVAVITVVSEDATKEVPFTIDVTGASSTDSDGTVDAYAWDFGDGTTSTAANPDPHTYSTARPYTIRLTVTDNDGATHTTTHSFVVIPAGATSDRIAYNPALVTATSYDQEQYPSRIGDRNTYSGHLDGGVHDTTGYWVGNATGTGFPHIAKIDLGASYNVDRVRYSTHRWNLGRTYQAQVFTSLADLPLTDPRWVPFTGIVTTAASATGDTAYEWTDSGTLAPVLARYVLIRLNSNSETNPAKQAYGGLWEAEVYGRAPDSGAPGAAFTWSAATDEDALAPAQFGPAKAIDGIVPDYRDRFTRWAAPLIDGAGDPASKWWRGDLGSARAVGRVRVYWYRPSVRVYTYRLEGATSTGGPWTNLFADAATSHVSGSGEYTEETFPAVACRYLRVTVDSCSQGGVSVPIGSIYEVEAYGS